MNSQDQVVLFKIAGEIVLEIVMSLSDKISDLKQKIETELGVAVARQCLWHNNSMLMDHEVISKFGFGRSEIVELTLFPLSPQHEIKIMVKSHTDGHVMMKETDMVSDLRGKVERRWGLPSELISLTYRNVVMEDDLPLSAYYITEGSEVHLKVLIEPR